MARTTSSDAIGRIAVYARQLGLDISELDLREFDQMQATHERISSAIHELLFGPEDKGTRPAREQVQDAIREELGTLDPGAVLTGRAADKVLALFGAESDSAAPEPGTQLHLPPEPPEGSTVELRGNPQLAERWRCQRVVDDLRWVKQNSSTGEARALSWPGLWRRALDGVTLGGQGDFTRYMAVVPAPVKVGTTLAEGGLVHATPGTWVVDAKGRHGIVRSGKDQPGLRTLAFDCGPLVVAYPLTVKGLPE